MAKRQEGLYVQLDKQCNAGQIQDLLRKHKHKNEVTKKEIQITGTKEAVIRQLSVAIDSGHIPLDDALNLLRDCEENGQQHIFYFRPTESGMRICRDFDTIIESIFGEEQLEDFPVYDYPQDGFAWVDFRKGLPGRPNDWVLKAYGQDTHNEVESRRERNGKIYLVLAPVQVKAICLVRWNSPDLLEIRIDSAGLSSITKREQRLQAIKDLLEPGLPETEYREWDLTKARSFMAANHEGHPVFGIDKVGILDRSGAAWEINCKTDQDLLEDIEERSAAVKSVMERRGKGRSISLHWKIRNSKVQVNLEVDEEGSDKSEDYERVGSTCGGRFTHEVAISARVLPQVVDHVTTKLRQFNR